MRKSDISIEDQEKMQGIYNSDKKLTYKGIAKLYRDKYPDITASLVGTIIRERNRSGEQYVETQDKGRIHLNLLIRVSIPNASIEDKKNSRRV